VSLVEGVPVVVVVADQSGTKRYVGLSRSAAGVAAFDPMCTHQGYLLEPRNGEWYCDYHGSRFAPASGDVLQGPARSPMRRYEVVERDGTVYVTL
jgi:Rieske Fe-S protein